MIKIFTQNDLIRLLYQETSEEETKEIKKALLCDSELQAQYNELKVSIDALSEVQLQPSFASVLNILSYSRSAQRE
ncbi:MAG: hypothetical protein ACKO13_00640 [Cytophagales bacterium]